jgi:hypothetical protein
LNTVESPLGYVACLLNLSFDVLSVICRLQNLLFPFKIPFYLVLPIVFSFRAHTWFYLGTTYRLSWNGTHVSHCRFHDNHNMNTSEDVSKIKIVPVLVKCWVLFKPVLGGVDGSLHLTVQSMNRLNQTESATFSILPCWAFLRDSYFLYFYESARSILLDNIITNEDYKNNSHFSCIFAKCKINTFTTCTVDRRYF